MTPQHINPGTDTTINPVVIDDTYRSKHRQGIESGCIHECVCPDYKASCMDEDFPCSLPCINRYQDTSVPPHPPETQRLAEMETNDISLPFAACYGFFNLPLEETDAGICVMIDCPWRTRCYFETQRKHDAAIVRKAREELEQANHSLAAENIRLVTERDNDIRKAREDFADELKRYIRSYVGAEYVPRKYLLQKIDDMILLQQHTGRESER